MLYFIHIVKDPVITHPELPTWWLGLPRRLQVDEDLPQSSRDRWLSGQLVSDCIEYLAPVNARDTLQFRLHAGRNADAVHVYIFAYAFLGVYLPT